MVISVFDFPHCVWHVVQKALQFPEMFFSQISEPEIHPTLSALNHLEKTLVWQVVALQEVVWHATHKVIKASQITQSYH